MNERHPHARPVADDRDSRDLSELVPPEFVRVAIGVLIVCGIVEIAYQIALAVSINARLYCP